MANRIVITPGEPAGVGPELKHHHLLHLIDVAHGQIPQPHPAELRKDEEYRRHRRQMQLVLADCSIDHIFGEERDRGHRHADQRHANGGHQDFSPVRGQHPPQPGTDVAPVVMGNPELGLPGAGFELGSRDTVDDFRHIAVAFCSVFPAGFQAGCAYGIM